MDAVINESVSVPLQLNLAYGSRWLNEWLPSAWTPVDGVVDVGAGNAPLSDILANLKQCDAYTDAQRLYNVYSERTPESVAPGWLSVADPYFTSRAIPIPTGASMGYTVSLDKLVADALYLPAGTELADLTIAVADEDDNASPNITVDAHGIWSTASDYQDLPVWSVPLTLTVTKPAAPSRELAVAVADQPISLGTADVVDLSSNLDGSSVEGAVTFKLYQYIESDIRVPLRNSTGGLRDTTALKTAGLVYREQSILKSLAANGVIADGYATFEGIATDLAGMFECQLWACKEDGTVAAIFPVFVNVVQTGLNGPGIDVVNKVRSRFQDDKQSNNLLLKDFEFDTESIIKAAKDAIDLYNSVGRPTRLTTRNFPIAGQHVWVSATMGFLLQGASFKFARNHMRYQAGDVALDDQAKSAEYYALSQPLLEEMRDYANFNKTREAITSRGAWGTF